MNTVWSIQQTTCKQCGRCVEICPNRIIQKTQDGMISFRDDRLWMCFKCGHCMAMCPTKSVQIPYLSYDHDFYAQPKWTGLEAEQFDHLIMSRRAVRSFLDKPVPHELVEKIVLAIQSAPPGFPPVKTEITVVEDLAIVRQAQKMMIEFYQFLIDKMRNQIARQFIRMSAGREKFITLDKHVVPLMINRMPDLISGKEDTITRHAPAMILFHANRGTENYRTDIHIALTYGFLAAHSLGLGASAMDLIPPAVENKKELRDLLKIPENNEVVASMILGFPKYHFLRGIKRDLKSVTWF